MTAEGVWAAKAGLEPTRARLSHPTNDARDAVDRDLRAVRNATRGIGDAKHHRHAALAPERREVRRAAAALGDDASDAGQDVAGRRVGWVGEVGGEPRARPGSRFGWQRGAWRPA